MTIRRRSANFSAWKNGCSTARPRPENKLIKGEFRLGDKKINLKNITMPLLNVYGTKDNLIPPSASIPLTNAVGSKDKEEASFAVGHAGIVASSLSQKEVTPKIAGWIKDHCKK